MYTDIHDQYESTRTRTHTYVRTHEYKYTFMHTHYMKPYFTYLVYVPRRT